MGPSRLPESPATLVLDASAVLNLLGTGRAADVLRLVGRETVIVEEAVREVERNPLDGSAGSAAIDALVCAGLLHIRPLLPSGYEVFANLVAAPSPDGLDDGEAATVAYAVDVGGIPLLDEKKATRIATTLPVPAPLCTLDLLSHTSVEGGWGVRGTGDRRLFCFATRPDAHPGTFSPLDYRLSRSCATARMHDCLSTVAEVGHQVGLSSQSIAHPATGAVEASQPVRRALL